MNSKQEDRTFKVIIISAFIIVISSLVICLVIFFMSNKKTDAVYSSQAKGEFVGYISPSEDKNYSSQEVLSLSVSAKNGSEAYAMIMGQKILLNASSASTDGYCVFTGNYTLPASSEFSQQLGNAAFFVTYEGITQICYGGKITVDPLPPQSSEVTDALILPSESGIQLQSTQSETIAQGSNSAVVVTGMIAEGKEDLKNELVYDPTYGNLITGMTDYAVSKIINYDDDGDPVNYYKLMSGRAVKEDQNISLTNCGSITYDNAYLSVVSDSEGKKIKISRANKAPYRLNYVGQTFDQGYEKLKYNVEPFCATAIDFIFEYSASFTGSLSQFSDEVISGVNASVNADDKTLIIHCVLNRPGKFYGYNMEYDANGDLYISFRQPVKKISDLSIIIDPGHGGTSGAVDQSGKYREADQTLSISKNLASYLAAAGARVYMTRTSDIDVSLETRRLMNQQIKPDLFLSVHLNGAEKKSRNGASTYYFTPFSQPIASFIKNRLVEIYTGSCYKENKSMLKNIDGGDNYYPFFVTRTDVCPSVLIEVGYITNETECKYLVDAAYQQAFGKAIYDAILDFILSQQ